MIHVAGRHYECEDGDKVMFLYKDLEAIFRAYGFKDKMSPPMSSKNLKFEDLDSKSIRIMNRLATYMNRQGFSTV